MAHRLADKFRSVVAFLSPLPSDNFISKGTLTPNQFLEAGDLLTFKFPTWEWHSAAAGQGAPWLPTDRQYLLTRNVPCRRRVKDLDVYCNTKTTTDGWLITGEADDENKHADVPDLAAAEIDICTESIVYTRTYDLSITYDKYYQTPRIWLFGYSEYGTPLAAEEVFEDFSPGYLHRTVTVDPHPCTGIPTVSIHPCRHAEMMRRVIDRWTAAGTPVRSDWALFVLLKFSSSVFPTIDYDFTTDVQI